MLSHSHPHDLAPQTRGSVIRWAAHYDVLVRLLMFGQDHVLRETTVSLAGIQPGQRVLDVGCGTGEVALVAKRWAGVTGEVSGIDPSPEMIEVARHKAEEAKLNIDYQVGVVESLPFPDQSFDVVLSSLMMHHLPMDLKPQALAEIRRVLKPNGQLFVLDVKHPTSLRDRVTMALFLHGATREGVQNLAPLMQTAGFAQVEVGDTQFGMLGYARARTHPQS